MPQRCEFAERQFEAAVRDELLGRTDHYFIPSQVLEGDLGFDLAIVPRAPAALVRLFGRSRSVWDILARPQPEGVELSAELWRVRSVSGPLPTGIFFSLFLQFKRAIRIYGHNLVGWAHWRAPFYRSEAIRQPQHRLLCTLETLARRRAYVRYSSPAFLTLAELQELPGKEESSRALYSYRPLVLAAMSAGHTSAPAQPSI